MVILALVQGITEFLPISSSAHLILVPSLTDWPDQGLDMDVALHVGTLLAVMIYFRRETFDLARGVLLVFAGQVREPAARLALAIIIGTVPVVIAGLLLYEYVGTTLRSIEVIGWATLGFGGLLWVADRIGLTVRQVEHATLSDALVIGLAQAVSLVPGTSRSGITMTAARLLGYERAEAARISLLLAIPTILAAGGLATKDLIDQGSVAVTETALMGAALAFVSALIAIRIMMAWLRHAGFGPFVLYRVLLGVGLLAYAYGYWPL